jgi:hypothetical protein
VGDVPIDNLHESTLSGFKREFDKSSSRIRLRLLLGAICYCGSGGVPLPIWINEAVRDAFGKWDGLEVDSLDEAFGLPFPTKQPKRRARTRRNRHRVTRFLKIAAALHQSGRPIDWGALAKAFDTNKTFLQEIYYKAFPGGARKTSIKKGKPAR